MVETTGAADGLRRVKHAVGEILLAREALYISGANTYVGIAEADRAVMDAMLGQSFSLNEWQKSPLRRVSVDSFAMDKYAVTRGEFLQFMASLSKSHLTPARAIDFGYWERFSTHCTYPDDAPIVTVSFGEASLYAWCQGGRLPTEEEWELAARGPNLREVPSERLAMATRWKETSEDPQVDEDTKGMLLPVGHGDLSWTSPYGVHGLIGNASEWTDSCFDVSSTHFLEARVRFSDDHWGAKLSQERILKPVGVESGCPHPGRRSVLRREFRYPVKHGGKLSRELSRTSMAGFRCAYDI